MSASRGDARPSAPPPQAYESIRARAALPKNQPAGVFEFLQAKNGMPIAKRNGVFLDSSYNPEAAARARADRMDIQDKHAAVLFGDGFCYLARTLASRGLQVFVVENDSELMANALRLLGDDAFRGFHVLFTNDSSAHSVADCLEPFIDPLWQINDILIVPAPAAADPVLRRAETALMTLFKRRKFNLETSAWFGERWACNVLDNLCTLRLRGPMSGAGQPRGAVQIHRGDWVIAAPGPSLDTAADLLGKRREHFTLLALAPALRPLLERGITPDLIASSDGGWANGLHLTGLNCPEIPLLFPLFCYGGIARAWQGPLIPFSYGSAFESLFLGAEAMPIVPEAPTVALFALRLAARFGAERIFFAGQDFASFSSKGHARGYRFDADAGYRGTRIAPPEKYLGGTWRRGDKPLPEPPGWRSDTKMRMYAEAFTGALNALAPRAAEPPAAGPAVYTLGASPLAAALPEAHAAPPPFSGRGAEYSFALPSCALAPNHPEQIFETCLRLRQNPSSPETKTLFTEPRLETFFSFTHPVAFYHYSRGEHARAEELLLARLPGTLGRSIHRLRILLNNRV